jgi:hypothetical protein
VAYLVANAVYILARLMVWWGFGVFSAFCALMAFDSVLNAWTGGGAFAAAVALIFLSGPVAVIIGYLKTK